jgi:hypothetical protein
VYPAAQRWGKVFVVLGVLLVGYAALSAYSSWRAAETAKAGYGGGQEERQRRAYAHATQRMTQNPKLGQTVRVNQDDIARVDEDREFAIEVAGVQWHSGLIMAALPGALGVAFVVLAVVALSRRRKVVADSCNSGDEP